MNVTDPVTYSIDDGEAVAEAIVTAVAILKGEDVENLPPLYYEGLHPDGLNMLFSTAERGYVEFPYCGTRVLIRHGDEIVVAPEETIGYSR